MKLETRLGLYVTEKRDGGYYHLTASIVTIGLTAYERRAIDQGVTFTTSHDTIRNAGTDLERGLYLENLQVTSQGNDADANRRLYAWEVRYQDIYAVDASKAERMAKTLKTIEARMSKLETKYGNPATFGSYLARVADAIGADTIIRPDGLQRGWSYSENSQAHHSIRDGVYIIDRMVLSWAKPTAEPVSA